MRWVKLKRKKLPPFAKNIASGPRLWLHPVVPHVATNARRRRISTYSGHVQGVGFRYTARTVAAGFEVAGTIRNLPDGRVELVLEGDHAELEAYCQTLRESGLAGFIRDEVVCWADATNEFRGFEIVR